MRFGCVRRWRRQKTKGKWRKPQAETVHLIDLPDRRSLATGLAGVNRNHWGIEIMPRNKDVILGEDGYPNRCANAPRNIFSLAGFVPKILKSVSPSPTRAIEHFQEDRNRAARRLSDFH
jgi:hypothetical protein